MLETEEIKRKQVVNLRESIEQREARYPSHYHHHSLAKDRAEKLLGHLPLMGLSPAYMLGGK